MTFRDGRLSLNFCSAQGWTRELHFDSAGDANNHNLYHDHKQPSCRDLSSLPDGLLPVFVVFCVSTGSPVRAGLLELDRLHFLSLCSNEHFDPFEHEPSEPRSAFFAFFLHRPSRHTLVLRAALSLERSFCEINGFCLWSSRMSFTMALRSSVALRFFLHNNVCVWQR